MVKYNCEVCGKCFGQKSHWVRHTQNKKFPCEKNEFIKEEVLGGIPPKPLKPLKNKNEIPIENNEKSFCCEYCFKSFTRHDNLKRHISNDKCEILRLHDKQKENIFINLLEEEKIINQTKEELDDITNSDKISVEKNQKKLKINNNIDHIDFLIKQIKLLNDKIEEQKFDTKKKLNLMTNKYTELEKNNLELKITNEKLQTKMNKIVNKNKITNTNTNTNTNSNNITTNTVINNPVIKLVNFGSEDLSKISHTVFIDTIKSQGASLYNKAIEGIHFNKDHPENQNVYISDINRGKVMIYKDEKWFLDNW
jgi:hypothetical protein